LLKFSLLQCSLKWVDCFPSYLILCFEVRYIVKVLHLEFIQFFSSILFLQSLFNRYVPIIYAFPVWFLAHYRWNSVENSSKLFHIKWFIRSAEKYVIVQAQQIVAKYGPTVLLGIKDKPYNIINFSSKQYSVEFSEDTQNIISGKVTFNLVHKVICAKSKSYVFFIEEWQMIKKKYHGLFIS
jgi:hypothetical protein